MVLFLGGGFKHFLCSPLPGEMVQLDEHIFQNGLVQPPLSFGLCRDHLDVCHPFWRDLSSVESCGEKNPLVLMDQTLGLVSFIMTGPVFGEKYFLCLIWMFPKIGLPPNHPF